MFLRANIILRGAEPLQELEPTTYSHARNLFFYQSSQSPMHCTAICCYPLSRYLTQVFTLPTTMTLHFCVFKNNTQGNIPSRASRAGISVNSIAPKEGHLPYTVRLSTVAQTARMRWPAIEGSPHAAHVNFEYDHLAFSTQLL